MGAYDDLFSTGYIDDVTTLDAETLNDLFQVLPMQGEGALEAIGEGIADGFEGSLAGLDFTAAAGKAIIAFIMGAVSGVVYVSAPSGLELTLPDDTANVYLWLVAQMPDTTDYDSRKDGAVVLVYTLTDTQPANSLPLEAGHTSGGAYTQDEDRRVYTSAGAVAELQAAVAALETAVGIPYANPASLSDRMDDMEATGGSASGGYRYWEDMPKNSGDDTPPGTEMNTKDAAAVAAHVVEYHDGSGDPAAALVSDQWDVDATNQALALLEEVAEDNPLAAQTQIDSVVIVWGIWGDGTGGSVDYVDHVNTTWV